MGGQRHAPTALPPGRTLYPLYRRLDGRRSRTGVENFAPTGIRSLDRPARSSVAIPTALCRLRFSLDTVIYLCIVQGVVMGPRGESGESRVVIIFTT
jgi:hypothetical protein